MIRHRSFLDRLLTSTCSGDPGLGGDGAGGGTAPAPEPASTPSEPVKVGGGTDQPYDHKFPQPAAPTPESVASVRSALAKESSGDPLSMFDIKNLLEFNPPFQQPEPPKDPTKPEAQVTPPVDPKQTKTDPKPPAAAQPQDQTQAIVQALREVLPQVAQPQPPKAPEAPKRYYGDHKPAMQVAPQLTQALFQAENPEQAHQALNLLVSGMMNQIMQDVASDQAQLAKMIFDRVPQIFQNHYQANNAFSSFYNDYPELNKPAFAETIKGLATALAEQRQRSGQPLWDQTFRQTLGEAVHVYLKQQFGFDIPRGQAGAAPVIAPQPPVQAQTPPVEPKQNGANGAQVPWMTPGGSRPPAGSGVRDKSADMFDLIM